MKNSEQQIQLANISKSTQGGCILIHRLIIWRIIKNKLAEIDIRKHSTPLNAFFGKFSAVVLDLCLPSWPAGRKEFMLVQSIDNPAVCRVNINLKWKEISTSVKYIWENWVDKTRQIVVCKQAQELCLCHFFKECTYKIFSSWSLAYAHVVFCCTTCFWWFVLSCFSLNPITLVLIHYGDNACFGGWTRFLHDTNIHNSVIWLNLVMFDSKIMIWVFYLFCPNRPEEMPPCLNL